VATHPAILEVPPEGVDASFNVRVNGAWAPATLVGGAVATYVW
jgi:hypothetical protein